jgi:hypothetical protein
LRGPERKRGLQERMKRLYKFLNGIVLAKREVLKMERFMSKEGNM